MQTICGTVVSHAKRGTELGFPTANIELLDEQAESGVYAAWVDVANTTYPAAVFIGPAEQFGETVPKLEAHLLDVNIDLYGQEMCVRLAQHIRHHQVFPTVEDLIAAIEDDITKVRVCLQESPNK